MQTMVSGNTRTMWHVQPVQSCRKNCSYLQVVSKAKPQFLNILSHFLLLCHLYLSCRGRKWNSKYLMKLCHVTVINIIWISVLIDIIIWLSLHNLKGAELIFLKFNIHLEDKMKMKAYYRDLNSFGILRSAEWWFLTEVSELHIGSLTLEDRMERSSRNVGKIPPLYSD